jgi:hypothetical protein
MSSHKTTAAATKLAPVRKPKVSQEDKDRLMLKELERIRKTFSDVSDEVSQKLVLMTQN